MRILKFRKYNSKLGMEYFDWLPDDRGDEIWMQFTGLFDRHGKEIYEDDIMELVDDWDQGKKYRKVMKYRKFYNPDFPVELGDANLNIRGIGFALSKDIDEWIIVGNVHENPELIK